MDRFISSDRILYSHQRNMVDKIKLGFSTKRVLGRGNSTVFYGILTGKSVAVKRIPLKSSLKEDEFRHQMELKHENVLVLLAVFQDIRFRYIVLEFCSGSLMEVIKKTYEGTPLPSDREVMYQIASALDYVHSQNLIHLDVKPDNILVSKKGSLKLADFGSCMATKDGSCNLNGSVPGTLSWRAPEVYQEGSNINSVVSTQADVFSCGCVFLVFLSREKGGIHPFGDRNEHQNTQLNICEGYQANIEELKSLPNAHFILSMIEQNPVNRGSLREFMTNITVPIESSNIPSNRNTNAMHQTLAHPHPVIKPKHEIDPCNVPINTPKFETIKKTLIAVFKGNRR